MMTRAVRALVQIGAVETPYLRAGEGALSVLLLRARASSEEPGRTREEDPVFEGLARTFRVISPLMAPPRAKGEGERWLRGVIDGLGLERPVVVADAELVPLLFRFSFRDRARIGAVVILPDEGHGAGTALPTDRLLDALGRAGVAAPLPEGNPSG